MKLEHATLDLLDTAEFTVSIDVDLAASIGEVWDVLADNTSWTSWFHKCARMDAPDDVWTEAGQLRTIHSSPFVIEEIALAVDRPNRWAICLTRTNLPMATRMIEVLDLSDTSRQGEERTGIRWTAAFDLPFYLRPGRKVMETLLARTWGTSFEALQDTINASR